MLERETEREAERWIERERHRKREKNNRERNKPDSNDNQTKVRISIFELCKLWFQFFKTLTICEREDKESGICSLLTDLKILIVWVSIMPKGSAFLLYNVRLSIETLRISEREDKESGISSFLTDLLIKCLILSEGCDFCQNAVPLFKDTIYVYIETLTICEREDKESGICSLLTDLLIRC